MTNRLWMGVLILTGLSTASCKIEIGSTSTSTATYTDDSSSSDPCRAFNALMARIDIESKTFSLSKIEGDFKTSCSLSAGYKSPIDGKNSELEKLEATANAGQKALIATAKTKLASLAAHQKKICEGTPSLETKAAEARALDEEAKSLLANELVTVIAVACAQKEAGTRTEPPHAAGEALSDRKTSQKPERETSPRSNGLQTYPAREPE